MTAIGALLEDIAEEEEPVEEEDDGEIGEEDEMADFIVDEEFDDNGAPVRYFLILYRPFVCVSCLMGFPCVLEKQLFLIHKLLVQTEEAEEKEV